MPNWVRNKVTFGTDKVIKDCVVKIDGHKQFDFNKIIPMPHVLDDDGGGLDSLTQEQRLIFLKENDGCSDWYSWRLRFWGTKWNAAETVVTGKNEVVFDTAWSMPDEIYKAISKKYHTTVEVEYADECIGDNCGMSVYENGEEVDYSQGTARFAEKVWEYVNQKRRNMT